MKEAQELRKPTDQYFAQPLEVLVVYVDGVVLWDQSTI